MPAMTRKQLYIEARQDKALKRRAKHLGVSEADLVRRAIDLLFTSVSPEPTGGVPISAAADLERKRALSEFLTRARAVAQGGSRLPHGGAGREELYDERLDRWTGRPG